jgi:hypothetical protein
MKSAHESLLEVVALYGALMSVDERQPVHAHGRLTMRTRAKDGSREQWWEAVVWYGSSNEEPWAHKAWSPEPRRYEVDSRRLESSIWSLDKSGIRGESRTAEEAVESLRSNIVELTRAQLSAAHDKKAALMDVLRVHGGEGG